MSVSAQKKKDAEMLQSLKRATAREQAVDSTNGKTDLPFIRIHVSYMISVALEAAKELSQYNETGARQQALNLRYYLKILSGAIWRLGVDGLTKCRGLRFDGAKYETDLPGRYASKEARRRRKAHSDRTQSGLYEHGLRSEHAVPRIVVARWLVLNVDTTKSLESNVANLIDSLMELSKVVILTKEQDESVSGQKGLKSNMPSSDWLASDWKTQNAKRHERYQAFSWSKTLGEG